MSSAWPRKPDPWAARTHAAVAEAITAWLESRRSDLLEPVHRWALTPHGKLVRPVVLLESAAAVGGCPEQAMPAAVGIELAHVGSLVHDDIIDGDELRRGRAAVHRRFGTTRAVLAGDALFFAFFQQLRECHRRGVPGPLVVEAMEIIGTAGQEIAAGVARETALSGRLAGRTGRHATGVAVEAYVQMARAKTAALLRAACRVGVVLGGGTRRQADALSEYGTALGVAFQIRDDLLPYRGGDAGDGDKPGGSDLRNQRPAFPLLLAHRLGTPADRALLAELYRGTAPERERRERLRRLVEDTGALAEARRMGREYIERCHRVLATLPSGPHRDVLHQLADLVAERPDDPGPSRGAVPDPAPVPGP